MSTGAQPHRRDRLVQQYPDRALAVQALALAQLDVSAAKILGQGAAENDDGQR